MKTMNQYAGTGRCLQNKTKQGGTREKERMSTKCPICLGGLCGIDDYWIYCSETIRERG